MFTVKGCFYCVVLGISFEGVVVLRLKFGNHLDRLDIWDARKSSENNQDLISTKLTCATTYCCVSTFKATVWPDCVFQILHRKSVYVNLCLRLFPVFESLYLWCLRQLSSQSKNWMIVLDLLNNQFNTANFYLFVAIFEKLRVKACH